MNSEFWFAIGIVAVALIAYFVNKGKNRQPQLTKEQHVARVHATMQERADKYRAGQSIQSLSAEYNRSERAVVATLVRAGAYKTKKNQIEEMEALLVTSGSRKWRKSIFAVGSDIGLAIDQKNENLALLSFSDGTPSVRVLSYRDLLSAEVVENDVTITRTSQSTKIGSAIVGGLLLGGVGAIVGAVAGSSNSQSVRTVNSLSLKLLINDADTPVHTVLLLDRSVSSDSDEYLKVHDLAQTWNDLLAVLVRRADADGQGNTKVPKNVRHSTGTKRTRSASANDVKTSAVDEIERLVNLRSSGAISTEEFDALKRKVMGDSGNVST